MSSSVCPFCNDNVAKNSFLTEKDFLAVYNIAPILPGHTLIVPRHHCKSILELQDKQFAEFFEFARKTTQFLLKVFDGEGFDWSLQENDAAGQTIEHLHLHIIIRRKNDLESPGDWYPMLQNNENKYIDSAHRTKLSLDEHLKITEFLRSKAAEEFA